MKSKFARNTKRGQMEGPNNFSCGGQFLEKWFKYAILPTLKNNFKTFVGAMAPPITNVASPPFPNAKFGLVDIQYKFIKFRSEKRVRPIGYSLKLLVQTI